MGQTERSPRSWSSASPFSSIPSARGPLHHEVLHHFLPLWRSRRGPAHPLPRARRGHPILGPRRRQHTGSRDPPEQRREERAPDWRDMPASHSHLGPGLDRGGQHGMYPSSTPPLHQHPQLTPSTGNPRSGPCRRVGSQLRCQQRLGPRRGWRLQGRPPRQLPHRRHHRRCHHRGEDAPQTGQHQMPLVQGRRGRVQVHTPLLPQRGPKLTHSRTAKAPPSSPRPSATAPLPSGSRSRAPRSLATPKTSRTTVSSPTTPPAVSPSTAPSATASARARSLSRPLILSTLTRRRDRRPSSCLQELRRAEEGVGAEDGCGGTRWAMIYLVDDFVMIFMY